MANRRKGPMDHVLQPQYSTETPVNLMFFDTETMPIPVDGKPGSEKHILRLWVAITCRYENGEQTRKKVHSGKTSDEFWDLLGCYSQPKKPLWMFSHNLGFDLTVLKFWEELLTGRLCVTQRHSSDSEHNEGSGPVTWTGMAIINDPPTIFKVRIGQTKEHIMLIDTVNYFNMRLADIGESMRIPKAPMPAFDSSDELWKRYCLRDCEIVEKMVISMIRMIRENELGSLKFTAAGNAMCAYRTKFVANCPKIYIHSCNTVKAMERRAYYGGLVRQYYCGKVIADHYKDQLSDGDLQQGNYRDGRVYHLDVNSCYPHVMANKLYPVRMVYTAECPGLVWLQTALDEYGCVADVHLECQPPGFPVRHNGKTLRAHGKLITTLCGCELQRAFREKAIRGIGRCSVYNLQPIFTEYVLYFYHLRKQYEIDSNYAFAELCKMYLNSLFGKFSQHSNRWLDVSDTQAVVPYGYWYEQPMSPEETGIWRSLGWLPQKQLEAGEHRDSFPAISAFVTAYAREYMLWLIDMVGTNHVYYSDTDSIICDDYAFQIYRSAELINQHKLGLLKVKGQYSSAEFRGPKDYSLGDLDTIAGLPSINTPLGGRRFKAKKFAGIVETVRSGSIDGVATKDVILDYSSHAPVGKVHPDGTVESLRLEMW